MSRICKISSINDEYVMVECKIATVETSISPIDGQIRKVFDINLENDFDEIDVMTKISKILEMSRLSSITLDQHSMFNGLKYDHVINSAKLIDKNNYISLLIEITLKR